MARFFSHKDGRLRTGRVAFLVFVGFMVCLGAVFQMSKPINETVVRVKHVFEPQEDVEVKKEETSQQTKEQPPVEDKRIEKKQAALNAPVKVEKPSDMTREEPEQKEPPAEKLYKNPDQGAPEAAEASMPEKDVKKEVLAEEAPQENARSDSTAQTMEEPEALKEADLAENKTTNIVRKEITKEEPPEAAPEEAPLEENTDIQKTKLADTGIMKLRESFNGENTEVKKTPEKLLGKDLKLDTGAEKKTEKENDIDITGKLGKLLEDDNTGKTVKEKISTESIVSDAGTGSRPVADSDTSITVESAEYMTLLKGWQSAGKKFDGDTRIPLSVENLENVYELFQMKPVAITGGRFIDLKDGAVIQENVLEPYSSTVFEVDRPWEKWGTGLKRAGIEEGRKVDVRYYMYGFIRNAIYSRVGMCFECMKSKGLIPEGTMPDEVDVLGRVYAVNRKGGGSFGVFVPLTIYTKDGKAVEVDSGCFDGQPDITALKTAGVLK